MTADLERASTASPSETETLIRRGEVEPAGLSDGLTMNAEELIKFERDVAEHFNAGRIRAPVHLAGGNEEQLIALFQDVKRRDWIATNWRSHYHCLLKGVPAERLMADILAGRSITLAYPEYRIISSAIVGGALPIALGLALSIKRRGGRERVHTFLGDMSARTGIYHECIQYAAGHDLPIRFIVERNGKSVCTNTEEVWGHARRSWSSRVESYTYLLPWPHSGAGKRVEF